MVARLQNDRQSWHNSKLNPTSKKIKDRFKRSVFRASGFQARLNVNTRVRKPAILAVSLLPQIAVSVSSSI